MKRNDTVVSRLAEIPIFASCTRRELALVSRLATELEVPAGATLTTQGRPGNEFAIVLEGTASLSVDGDTVTSLSVGDHYGEMALLDDGPRTATITALTRMTLVVVGRRDFRHLLDQSPILARALLVGLARRLREVETRTSI